MIAASRADLESLGRKLWGEPNATMSSRDEIRFGKHGSKSIHVRDATWFDHEAGEGGGYVDLHKKAMGQKPGGDSIGKYYDYRDATGTLVFQVVRRVPKSFVQRRPDGNGGWLWNMKGITRLPYRLPELLNAAPGATVFLCEGEKDADALAERQLIATTNPGGAGKWLPSMSPYLKGRRVVILPDNDEAGEDHAKAVAASLRPHAAFVGILRLPDLPAKGDVSDWLAAGGTAEELEELERHVESVAAHDDPQPASDNTKSQVEPAWKLVNPATLAGITPPERQWVVQDWLPIGVTTANYGDGGVGKTLLAQQLQMSTALQLPWCGMAVRPCRSIGLYCEDDEDELHRRQIRMCDSLGVDMADLGAMRWISGVGHDNGLCEPEGERMFKTRKLLLLETLIDEHSAELVVLDTAADLYLGNEINRLQVRQFIGFLNGIAHAKRCAILLNAHPSRAGMGKDGDHDGGSTAWSNTVRSRWSLERPKDAEADCKERVLTRRKANYAARGETLKLEWRGGLFLPVQGPSGFAAMARESEADTAFLELLARTIAEGRHVSDSSNSSTYAPRTFAKRPDSHGLKEKDLEGAMQRLFAAGRIRMDEYGKAGGRGRASHIIAVAASPDADAS